MGNGNGNLCYACNICAVVGATLDLSVCLHQLVLHRYIFTPHAQRERGKVIGRGVHIYIYMSVVEKKI